MIRYTLKCSDAHAFESWFASAAAFDTLKASGMVACPVCGDIDVAKAVMAPRVRPSRNQAALPAPPPAAADPAPRPLQAPGSDAERALAEVRRKVEESSDYVGLEFANEARAMHDGEIKHRAIYGEAGVEEARKLIEDGIPVAPLPFIPQRKTN